MLLAVTSALIFAEQTRRQAGLTRNLASEYRMHVDYQSSAIRSMISDCARRSAEVAGTERLFPVIVNRRPTDFPHFPQMPGTASDQELVELSKIACPLNDAGTTTASPLFRPEQLSLPPGLGPWRYRNQRRSASGLPAVELQISAADDNAVARNTLIALFEKSQRSGTAENANQRIYLSDRTRTNLTLGFILAEQP